MKASAAMVNVTVQFADGKTLKIEIQAGATVQDLMHALAQIDTRFAEDWWRLSTAHMVLTQDSHVLNPPQVLGTLMDSHQNLTVMAISSQHPMVERMSCVGLENGLFKPLHVVDLEFECLDGTVNKKLLKALNNSVWSHNSSDELVKAARRCGDINGAPAVMTLEELFALPEFQALVHDCCGCDCTALQGLMVFPQGNTTLPPEMPFGVMLPPDQCTVMGEHYYDNELTGENALHYFQYLYQIQIVLSRTDGKGADAGKKKPGK